ncbi:hypothetical protein AAFF_G00024180 [Aldrovandia affinis]|uniref:Uncharacterized protein n=1 Tax=Aldrovandia affinis TaxID=143900 RepID=A0AAD7T5V5_9TELE|nr:hypothetical protein AAFF_G00024180 [Aldrovandia affinis]
MDCFLCALPFEAKKLVGQHVPTDPGDMVALVQWVKATREMLNPCSERPAWDRPRAARVSPELHRTTLDDSTTNCPPHSSVRALATLPVEPPEDVPIPTSPRPDNSRRCLITELLGLESPSPAPPGF